MNTNDWATVAVSGSNGNYVLNTATANTAYWTNGWPITTTTTYPLTTNSIIINPTVNDMFKSNYKEDRLVLMTELAGFTKDDIKVRYKNSENSNERYIEVIASSMDHPFNTSKTLEYSKTLSHTIKNHTVLDYDKAKISFVDGLLIIDIEYMDDSKVKELKIG